MPRRSHREIWAADCETDPFKPGRVPKPFIWGAYEIRSRRYECFGSERAFVDFFSERKCTCYFHNGGKFDLHYLRPYFKSDENILLINGRITRAKIGAAEFRDSYSLIPVPLAKYQKDEFDYSILEEDVRGLPENIERIEKYLKSDCTNLGNLLGQFFDRYGHALTQAGAAMSYWAKNHNGGKKPRQSAAQFERYRPYYYGGRVECFVSGVRSLDFKIVDKNSAYPDAMLAEHPISHEAMQLKDIPQDESDIQKSFLTVRGIARGCFPYRESNGELRFPRDTGERVYRVTGWEYLAALAEDAFDCSEVCAVHYFRETHSFADYIKYFYHERQVAKANGDKAGDLFSKLFMNSCYGGFAMNPENYHEYLLSSLEKLPEHLADGYASYHPWGDGRELLWRKLPLETQRRMYKNIATAASITGYVRAHLFRDLQRVQHPLYCDTDSISAVDISGLTLGGGLGQWKVEAECDRYAIAGKKLYAKRKTKAWWNAECEKADAKKEDRPSLYKVACKGVSLTPEEIFKVAAGEEVKYNPAVPTYSITRTEPRFTSRDVRLTAKPTFAVH